jgi:hypothetical protein
MQGYSELFAVYPDANSRSNFDLEHVFATSTSGGKQVVTKTVATFKSLCAEADFPDSSRSNSAPPVESGLQDANVPGQPPPVRAIGEMTNGTAAVPSVHIDIQIHILAEASVEQIDQIFSSMAKHLYGRT